MDEKEVKFAATDKLLITYSTDILGEWGSPGKYVRLLTTHYPVIFTFRHLAAGGALVFYG